MSHFLLAWELGTNFGHLSKLGVIATALAARGHRLDLAITANPHEKAFLPPELPRHSIPPMAKIPREGLSLTLEDNLLRNGWAGHRALADRLAFWNDLLDRLAPDGLLAESAPAAVAVARHRNLPRVAMGSDFTLPAPHGPGASLHPWLEIPETVLQARRRRFAAEVAPIFEEQGMLSPNDVMSVYEGCSRLLLQFPAHVARPVGIGEEAIGPLPPPRGAKPPPWPRGTGPRVFAYLGAEFRHWAELAEALRARDCPTLVTLRGRGGEAETCFRHESQTLVHGPLDLQTLLPSCDLVIHFGGVSLSGHAAAAGCRQLVLPTQLEQIRRAWHMERQGLVTTRLPFRSPPSLQLLLERALASAEPAKGTFPPPAQRPSESPTALERVIETVEAL